MAVRSPWTDSGALLSAHVASESLRQPEGHHRAQKESEGGKQDEEMVGSCGLVSSKHLVLEYSLPFSR